MRDGRQFSVVSSRFSVLGSQFWVLSNTVRRKPTKPPANLAGSHRGLWLGEHNSAGVKLMFAIF
jgi:hypothetical protein